MHEAALMDASKGEDDYESQTQIACVFVGVSMTATKMMSMERDGFHATRTLRLDRLTVPCMAAASSFAR